MSIERYKRTPIDLRRAASIFWPAELSQREAESSVIPKLLETQDDFIAILAVRVPDLDRLFRIIEASRLSANLFLKHLVVLADFGGEMLQRVNQEFESLFPTSELDYLWDAEPRVYRFTSLPLRSRRNTERIVVLNNDALGISGRNLIEDSPLTDLLKDIIALLLLGGSSVSEEVAQVLTRCEISNYLGDRERLDRFIKQRYIWVSRITSGAQSNTLGQLAQDFVKEYLETNLRIPEVSVKREGQLPEVTHRDPQTGRSTTFDIVVSAGQKHAAVEVSFQVTTNSTIERKAGQARTRYEQVESARHRIAYVIDGAGNFQRASALTTICEYSHCTVAFSRTELEVLCEFLRDYFTE